MGELEDRLKTGTTNKEPERVELKSELEKALEEEEAELARELRIGRAEEIIAKRESRIKQIREQIGKLGMTEEEREEEEKRKAEEELRKKAERIEQAKALYSSCIEAGGDPKQCAEMVAGLIPSQPVTPAAPPATSIKELVEALKTLDELRGSDKTLTELKASFDKLAEELKQGPPREHPLDPITFAKQQAEQTRVYYETLKSIGAIKEPETTSPTYQGEPLEVIQEKHRHEEKLEELKTERVYKEKLGEVISDLPERVGRGIAGQITEEEEEHSGGGLEYIMCTEEGCGTKIYITPETKATVTCPKCGSVYSRKGTVETKG